MALASGQNMFINGYFKVTDFLTNQVAGLAIHKSWWSRQYEYPWAFEFIKPGIVVADMGCGYTLRPFHPMLATKAEKVYAVDARSEARNLVINEPNIELVIADITKHINEIEPASLDRIFCLSVFEEGVDIQAALTEFKRLLKPGGLIVITFDVIANPSKPVGVYKGVSLDLFVREVKKANLEIAGGRDFSMENRLLHPDWNLAVFHCLLAHKDFQPRQQKGSKVSLVLDWIERNHIKDAGVAAWPGHIAYPEVSGYLIPTLLSHDSISLAKYLGEWLVTIQDANGGFTSEDGKLRSFDTAACMEGLEVASAYFFDKRFSNSAAKAKKWIMDNCLDSEGRIYSQPDRQEFRNYSLRVNGLLGITPKWLTSREPKWPFGNASDRTHYITYALEGLLTLGEKEMVTSILENIKPAITDSGFISYWVRPDWEPAPPFYACHNATAQIGLLLTKLNIKDELAKQLFDSLIGIIKDDGGLPTHPGSVDTSWTAKWFLDFEDAIYDSNVLKRLT